MWRLGRNLFQAQVSPFNPVNLRQLQALICKAVQLVRDKRVSKRHFGLERAGTSRQIAGGETEIPLSRFYGCAAACFLKRWREISGQNSINSAPIAPSAVTVRAPSKVCSSPRSAAG